MNIFRRLPLYRLLLLCGVVLVAGISVTALAMALSSGPTPPAKGLADAVHDALGGAQAGTFEGVSADVTLTNHLLEGAELAGGEGGSGLASNPLLAGASGRLWIAKNGRVRLELQSEQGDTQILYDGSTIELYDAATNTLYRYTPAPQPGATDEESGASSDAQPSEQTPSVANVEEGVAHLREHANVSGATPTDVAGRAAYTVRVSPNEGGSLLGGAELSFDAANGVPLRTAIYSSTSSSPVIELAATRISYGPVADSVFAFAPPANAKVETVELPKRDHTASPDHAGATRKLSTHGQGPAAIAVLETSGAHAGNADAEGGEAAGPLPQVKINGVTATELRTELGTLLSFERGGVSYLVAGSRTPADIEAFARGL